MTTTTTVARFAWSAIGDSLQEHVVTICLDWKNRVRAIIPTSLGSTDRATCVPADILRAVLLSGHRRFIIAHNHPSGGVEPSDYDDTVTKAVRDGADLIGLDMLDHIIVCPEEDVHYSYKEEGKL